MKDSRPNLPLRYQVVSTLGRLFVAAGLQNTRLDEGAVCQAAIKQTGLTDFGDPYYRQGLLRLLESAEQDANLHPLGRLMVNDMTTNYLVQRLRMVETRKQEPEIFEKPLLPPLIISGPARSGTTFLHNMLALDPAHRALPQWLLLRPFPEGSAKDDGPDPRYVKAEQGLRFRQPLLPGVDSIHYTRADTPEECIIVLGLTFNSLVFFTLLPVYSYMEWYLQQEELSQKFREYRWLLQVFQSHEPEQRLTLKAPAHTSNLGALLEAIPQALLIQTHRDPVACVSSVCSLLYTYHLGVANEIDIRRMTDLIICGYEYGGKRNLAFRAENPDLVYDVFYESLVFDPVGTIRDIYSHFGLPWTEVYESALKNYIQRNKKDKHGKHRYVASDYGLTEAEIAERFTFYTDYFDL
jgi:hypothetical protein